ncbi:MAG: mannosyltransferase family protein [Acidobacteriota bacterium]
MASIFLATRIPIFLLAWLATGLLASGDAAQPGNLHHYRSDARALQAWVHWDAEWYLLIAERGYGALQERPDLAPRNRPEDTSGFFPLYPGAIHALVTLSGGWISPLVAALLISNAAMLGLLYAMQAWLTPRLGEPAARAAGIALATFPTTLFLSAPYSESLFLLLAVGTLLSADRGRTLLSGLLGAAAALSRPIGFLLVLPLLFRSRGGWSTRLAAAGPALGLGAQAAFCGLVFGDPLAFVARQERWRGTVGPPWTFLVEFLRDPHPHGASGSVVDLTMALLCLALLPVVFRRVGIGPGLYATAALLLPLSSGLFSFSRLALGAFPLFGALGWLAGRQPRLRLAYLALSLPFAGFFTALYATGWWVG